MVGRLDVGYGFGLCLETNVETVAGRQFARLEYCSLDNPEIDEIKSGGMIRRRWLLVIFFVFFEYILCEKLRR